MTWLSPKEAVHEDPDYLYTSVPSTDRKPAWAVFSVFLGFIVVAGQMTVGGGLASQLSKGDLIAAVLIGNAIAGVFAAFAGYTGVTSGKSFVILTKEAFPQGTWRVACLYVPLVLIGWYAVEAAIFGSLLASAAGAGSIATRLFIVGSAILFASSTFIGFKGLRYVSYVAVPVMIGIGTYAIVRVMTSTNADFGFGSVQLSLGQATALVVGSWIMGALTCVPDLTRFNRSHWAAIAIGFFGILLGNSFNHLVGAAGAAFAKQADPAVILMTLGLVVPGLVFALANIWTTNDGNMYSASLNAAPVLGISRRAAVVLCTGLAAGLAMFRPHEMPKLFMFLGVLNVTAPALGAVVLGGYWLRRRGLIGDSDNPAPAWLGWIGGSGVAYITGAEWAFLTGFVVAGIIFWGATLLTQTSRRPALEL
ncbi:MAG TPA: cytosine permease [Longimicrobium sp.]|jgi:cytosine permease|uniref:cytosine permease n=1 Tax=Longimicrobium sp. TaxID=2029185 RepID=UPI002ED8643A